jgi:hypothetical protein
MATRFVGDPLGASFPASNYPALTLVNRRPVLAFDAGTDETAYWTFVAPQGWTGAVTCLVSYMMASATTGNIYWQAQLEAVTAGDAVDLDATKSNSTAISEGQPSGAAGDGMVLGPTPVGPVERAFFFETVAGEALKVQQSGTAGVGVGVEYAYVPDVS